MPKTPCIAAVMASLAIIGTPAAAQVEGVDQSIAAVKVTPLSQTEMEEIRGQGLPAWAVRLAVRQVNKYIGSSAGRKLERLLSGNSLPTYSEYRQAFGSKTALVLSLLPSILKPRIAE